MSERQQFQSNLTVSPELQRLLDDAPEATEEELKERRISFAYGNAMDSPLITKESVRAAAGRIRLQSSNSLAVRRATTFKLAPSGVVFSEPKVLKAFRIQVEMEAEDP